MQRCENKKLVGGLRVVTGLSWGERAQRVETERKRETALIFCVCFHLMQEMGRGCASAAELQLFGLLARTVDWGS